MATPIRFLFDYISPYAYLASTQIRALAARHAREVEPLPVLFAGLLDASGARGPAEIPAKREYMFHDVERLARSLGVPIEPPATHPFNPLLPLRATASVTNLDERLRLTEALFRATWARGLRVDAPETILAIANEEGFDGPALLAAAGSPEAKLGLRGATEDAIAAGVFGVPSMMADGELFWGVDSLPLLERHLRGEAGPDASRLERWRRVPPSATRPRGA